MHQTEEFLKLQSLLSPGGDPTPWDSDSAVPTGGAHSCAFPGNSTGVPARPCATALEPVGQFLFRDVWDPDESVVI